MLFLFFALNAALVQASETVSPEVLSQGKQVFAQNCVACHGPLGDGKGPAAAAIKDKKPRDFTKGIFLYGSRPKEIFKTITHGVDGTAMPSWSSLSESDRWAVIYYIKSLKKK